MPDIILHINKNFTSTEDKAIGNLNNGITIMPFESTVKGLAIRLKNANGIMKTIPFESTNGIEVETTHFYFIALTWIHSDDDYDVNVSCN